MSLNLKQWVAIVNPTSGRKAAVSEWPHIQQLFKRNGVNAVFSFTQEVGDATVLTKQLVLDGYRNIAVVGGDGTLNEVLNGVMLSGVAAEEVTLAVIPNGTGNDWARYWKIGMDDLEQSIKLLKTGSATMIDVGRCTYMIDGRPGERYFLNTAGMGLEVKVLQMTEILKRRLRGRSWIYGVALIVSAFVSRAHQMTYMYNGQTYNGRIFTLNVGNGVYSGGGFAQTPTASPQDGALDLMIMSSLSFKSIILGLKYVFTGRLLKHPCVKNTRTEKLVISTTGKSTIELDGIVIPASCPVTFSIASQKINFVVPVK